MIKYLTSALVATGDTVKTEIETLVLPASTKAILGVWSYADAGASVTIAEPVTGILELESEDLPISPCKVPLEQVVLLTSGMTSVPSHVWPLNAGGALGGARIKGSITMDMAMTSAFKARFGLVLDA